MTVVHSPGVPGLAFVQLLTGGTLEASAVARLRRVMAHEGVTEADLLAGQQAPLRWFREAYGTLSTRVAVDLGLACAEQAQLTSFGPVSVPLVSASTVAEVMDLLAFVPLISSAVEPTFRRSRDGLRIDLDGATGDSALDLLATVYCGSALLRFIELLAAEPTRVTFSVDVADDAELGPLASRTDDRWRFADSSHVEATADALTTSCRFADPLAYRQSVARLQALMNERATQATHRHHVCRILRRDVKASEREVAAALGMSTSTLKRRLAEEGTSFRTLRNEFLRERACRRLREGRWTVTQVAAELGYADVGNFSHAFKRWTGLSPREFCRDQALADATTSTAEPA